MLSVRSPLRALALGILIASLWSASPSAALPVTVYADGTEQFGFDPADVAAAISAGASQPTEVNGLTDGVPYITITTPDGITGTKGKDKTNPSTGSSIWTIHVSAQTPEALLQDFALVILGHDPNDPIEKYETGNVGLEIDTEVPWLFVTPEGEDPIYVAYLLGDLVAGNSYEVPIEYRVAQKLKKVGKDENGDKLYMFPRYAYAIASIPEVVPEPSLLALLALAAAAGFAGRRST
jgi:hypothetical protein